MYAVWGPLLGLLVLASLSACRGSADPGTLAPKPPRVTRATLAGPLCTGDRCRCRTRGRPGDDLFQERVPPEQASSDAPVEAGLPTLEGRKRYEFRIGPMAGALWVTVDEMVFYKDAEQALACFYVDLSAGMHPVRIQAEGEHGVGVQMSISEHSALGWYDTFTFACGAPGDCAIADLRDWQASLTGYERGIHDPCGSTKIREIAWRTGPMPDRLHPTSIQLDLIVDVYRFLPRYPSGHQKCAQGK